MNDTKARDITRLGSTAIAVVAVALLLLLSVAAMEARQDGVFSTLGCRLNSSLRVSWSESLSPACLLDAYDQVLAVRVDGDTKWVTARRDLNSYVQASNSSIEVRIRRDVDEQWIDLPTTSASRRERIGRLLVASLTSLLGFAFSAAVYLSTRSYVSIAAVGISGSVGCLIIILLTGVRNPIADVCWILASGFLPATVWHLGLLFPRPSRVASIHGVVPVLYAGVGVLVVGDFATSYAIPQMWPLAEMLSLGVLVAAAAILVQKCVAEIRFPLTPLHRAQAQAFIIGLAIVIGIPTAASWVSTSGAEHLSGLAIGLMLVPAPLAYVTARSTFLNVGVHAIAGMTYVGYALGISLVCAIVSWASLGLIGYETSAGIVEIVWAVSFCVASLSAMIFGSVRGRVVNSADGADGSADSIAADRTEQATVARLQRSLQIGISPKSIGVFVVRAGEPIRSLDGTSSVWNDEFATRAFRVVLPDSDLMNLVVDADEGTDAAGLRDSGLSLAATFRVDESRSLLVLLGKPRRWPGFHASHV